MTRPTQKNRVLAALQAHPRGITQIDFNLPHTIDHGPPITRVAARIEELADEGHQITDAGWRDKCKVYILGTSGAGPATRNGRDTAATPTPPPALHLGAYHVCDACTLTWHERPWPQQCPACKAAPWWVASFLTREGAQRHVPLGPAECERAAA